MQIQLCIATGASKESSCGLKTAALALLKQDTFKGTKHNEQIYFCQRRVA